MKVVAINHVTGDGVTQAPGRRDEDTRGGFRHGGWSVPYGDEVLGKFMGERMTQGAGLLLGKRTYKDLYGYWPSQTDNPYTDVLNKTTKYVASTTMHEPLPWSNSVLLPGDAADAIAKMTVPLELVCATPTTTGVILAVYRPARSKKKNKR